MKNNLTVGEYIKKHDRWKKELTTLHKIIHSTRLQETIKWGGPVYILNWKNVVGISAFKSHVALWFFHGALLKAHKKKLINGQENKTKALRQWRFSSQKEIREVSEIIREYIEEAISNQNQGKSIKPNRYKPLIMPKELEVFLSENKKVKEIFDELSKSKQREYAEFVAEAKREETKRKRLDKISPIILRGTGLNKKYKK